MTVSEGYGLGLLLSYMSSYCDLLVKTPTNFLEDMDFYCERDD